MVPRLWFPIACLVVVTAGLIEKSSAGRDRARRETGATLPPDSRNVQMFGGPSEDYVVGDSDVLRIDVWKEPEISQTVVVRPDGKISLPLVNEVKVSGMTTSQIQALLTSKLRSILTNPQVTIIVVQIQSKKAYVTGEVARPGPYSLVSPTTALQLITAAGGFTSFAKRRNIVILREIGGKQMRYRFDYVDFVRGRHPEQNIILRPGDTVIVP